jgi:hypothetical protein
MKKVYRLVAAGLGGLLLTGVGAMAFADTEDSDDVKMRPTRSARAPRWQHRWTPLRGRV